MSSLGATGHQSRQELLTWINSLELDYSVSQRGLKIGVFNSAFRKLSIASTMLKMAKFCA